MNDDVIPRLPDASQIAWPVADAEPVTRTRHGHTDIDPWAWMRDVDDPRLHDLLVAENAATTQATAGLTDIQATLFQEIRGRIQETDLSVPWRRGDWWYQVRTFEGRAYPVHLRAPATGDSPPEDDAYTVVLDENMIAEGHEHSRLGGAAVSPDGRWLAWSVDHTGDESHTLSIRDLSTGEDLDEHIEGVAPPLAWSADSTWVFSVTLDATQRPWQVWRHRVGTSTDEDQLVFQEDDERFFVDVGNNRSDDWIVISSQSAITGEHHLLDAHDPTGPLRIVTPRRDGVEQLVELTRDRMFVLTNADGAEDFALFEGDPRTPTTPWTTVIPHEPGVRLEDLDAFATHLVVHLRRGGTTGMRVLDLTDRSIRDLTFPETIGTVGASVNARYGDRRYRFVYESLVTPPTLYEENLGTGERIVLKTQPVLGGYTPDEYRSERLWVDADDGVAVPVSVVYRRDTPLDGTAPCLLYGYGAYEISIDPWFSAARLSLLERGWVFAVAHVRGGGELGRHWYEDGKFSHKTHSFTDFVAVARHLCATGFTAPDRLVARGGSAGGLLVGAALNLAPELFAGVIAEVPFVDPLNTLLDPTLPLTVTEWEEWGNPVDDPEAFTTIRGYAPYENVQPVPYPAVLATAGVNDPRVSVHEPLKWAQRLRAATTGTRPILLKVEMGAGHGGPTGRYDAWRDEAFVLAFALAAVDSRDDQPLASL